MRETSKSPTVTGFPSVASLDRTNAGLPAKAVPGSTPGTDEGAASVTCVVVVDVSGGEDESGWDDGLVDEQPDKTAVTVATVTKSTARISGPPYSLRAGQGRFRKPSDMLHVNRKGSFTH
ncbi:hypothetical protein GCM10009810_07220 [Nostocoides vanveenii]|uniref:Uncharacterized protein n=1 Tax=Nostocoides vanveenii TaxID=330835 RepID=A0ABP4W8Q0_9MICO